MLGRPNETTVRFRKNGDCVALVRREASDKMAWIGVSPAPYKEWKWKPAGLQIGGPNFIVLGASQWGQAEYCCISSRRLSDASQTDGVVLEPSGQDQALLFAVGNVRKGRVSKRGRAETFVVSQRSEDGLAATGRQFHWSRKAPAFVARWTTIATVST